MSELESPKLNIAEKSHEVVAKTAFGTTICESNTIELKKLLKLRNPMRERERERL